MSQECAHSNSREASRPVFAQEIVDAVVRHMVEDHAEDSLLIVRALGALPEATSARMVGFDDEGSDFVAVVDGVEHAVRIPWSQRITERAEVRAEVVLLHQRAAEALGLESGERTEA